jgi:hypothetical protein
MPWRFKYIVPVVALVAGAAFAPGLAARRAVAADGPTAASAPAAPVGVTAEVGEAGLASLKVAGAEVLGDGRLRVEKVFLRAADGSTHAAEVGQPRVQRDGAKVTWGYAWGEAACEYRTPATAGGGRVELVITVRNTSAEAIHELWLTPLSLRVGDKAHLPDPADNIGSPTVLGAACDGFALAVCNEDIDVPLRVGLERPRGAVAAVVVRAGGDRMVFDEIYMRRPIEPGKSDTYRLSLRFGRPAAEPLDLADDVLRKFAAAHPAELDWPDRRPIGRVFLSGGLPEAELLAYYRGGEKAPLPPADEKFRQTLLDKQAHAIEGARQIDCQGIVVWDIEGDVLPHATTYIGDPRLTRVMNPKMDHAADDYFAAFRKAGLRSGVCLRPSRVIYAADKDKMMQIFGVVKDPFDELSVKADYCIKRWDCSIFYVDTNYFWRPRGKGGEWTAGMLAADVFRRLRKAFPKCLFVPEHCYDEYWSCTAPYRELDCGYRGVPASVRRMYPKAFCVAVVEDADPHANWDMLVRMVRDGDCLMTFTYGLTGIGIAIRDVYAEARLLDAGPPEKLRGATPDAAAAALADKASDLPTRFHASRILIDKPVPQAAAVLLATAGNEKENWLVRKNAVIALGAMKATAATGLLGNLLVNNKANLKQFATIALKQISTVIKPSFGDTKDDAKPDPLMAP